MLMELWERYRRILLSVAIVLFLLISYFLYNASSEHVPDLPLEASVYASDSGNKQPAKDERSQPIAASTKADKPMSPAASRQTNTNAGESAADAINVPPQPAEVKMYVDVKGSVKSPGLYSFKPNDRIANAVEQAGGFLPEADRDRVNLAQALSDGMSIWIPAKGDPAIAPPAAGPSHPVPVVQEPAQPSQAKPDAAKAGVVNINTATVAELQTLPGIGETRAKAIIAYREQHGPFEAVTQLRSISGIGEKTYKKLESKITVN